jgi:hypothetical protein
VAEDRRDCYWLYVVTNCAADPIIQEPIIQSKVVGAEEAAKDEIWGGYRFAVIGDGREKDGLKPIDLGAGHSSASETLCGRVIAALKSQALLNESVGAGYIERNWPPALKESGAWPLSSLRQSFLNGSLTRLLDPDATLRGKIVEFVDKGDFGLASGQRADVAGAPGMATAGGNYDRVWFEELIDYDEVSFEPGVYLLLKSKAKALKAAPGPQEKQGETAQPESKPVPAKKTEPASEPRTEASVRKFRITGDIPPEIWNRLGTKILPKLRNGADLKIGISFSVTVDSSMGQGFEADLKQILQDLGIDERVKIESL